MNVRTLFLSCIGAIAAVAILASCSFIAVEWHSYRGAAEARNLAETLGALLRTTEKLTLSRGTQNSLLLADGPANDDARAKVATARRAITEALAAANAALANTTYADRPTAADTLRRFEADLAALFAELDAAYRVPKAERKTETLKSFIPRMLAFGNALNVVANGLERAAASADPTVGRLSTIARLSWDMRDSGGRRTTIFTSAIAAGRPLTAEQIEAAASFTGEARHAWARLEAIASQIDNSPGLSAAMKDAQARFFGQGDTLLAELTAKGRAGGDYGLSFDDAWGRLVGNTQAALGVRDAALAEAAQRSDAARAEALLRLAGAVGGLFLVLATTAGATAVFTRRVMTPLTGLIQIMARLAAGEHALTVPACDRRDEIGGMARAVEVFKNGLVEAERLSTAQTAAEQVRRQRADAIERLLADFEAMAAGVLGAVGTASGALDTTAQGMAAIAQRTNAEAHTASTAAETTTVNVQTVAAAAEEMTGSISEIGRQVTRSAEITGKAVAEAEHTNATVHSLEEAVERIGDVIKLITSIASQTNLLALNATIEAARAGEAGKGFAVVAHEVKQLAGQTAKATDDIATQIAAIQTATGHAVKAIAEIGGTIASVSDISASIAAAIEEQSAATSEISRNVQEAAQGTQRVSGSIAQVTEAAAQTDSAASQVLQAAGALSHQATVLRGGVERFLAAIKAA